MGPTDLEIWMGGVLVILILEGTRRTVGMPIVLVAVAFLAYGMLGPYMPDMLAHKGYSPQRLVSYLVWTTEGVFGIPIAVSATFVVVFIIFGAFLDKLGAGNFFIQLALALTGRRRGGPALTSVVASGLMGSISGSSVSQRGDHRHFHHPPDEAHRLFAAVRRGGGSGGLHRWADHAPGHGRGRFCHGRASGHLLCQHRPGGCHSGAALFRLGGSDGLFRGPAQTAQGAQQRRGPQGLRHPTQGLSPAYPLGGAGLPFGCPTALAHALGLLCHLHPGYNRLALHRGARKALPLAGVYRSSGEGHHHRRARGHGLRGRQDWSSAWCR